MGRHCYLAIEGQGFSSSHSKTKQQKTLHVPRIIVAFRYSLNRVILSPSIFPEEGTEREEIKQFTCCSCLVHVECAMVIVYHE